MCDKEMETVPLEEAVVLVVDRIGMLEVKLKRLKQENADLTKLVDDLRNLLMTAGVELGHGAVAVNDNRNDIAVLKQHQEVMRDKLHALALIVGALNNKPDGSLRWRVSLLEQSTILSSVLDLEQLRVGEVTLGEALMDYRDEPFPQLVGDVDTGNPEGA